MEKFPANSLDQVKLCLLLARARTEGRARGEGAGAHAEAGAERRRDVAEEIAAAGAVAVVGSGNCDIGAHPLAARFAERIDALHGETGQVLHLDSLRGRKAQVKIFATTEHPREKFAEPPGGASRCKSPAEKKTKYQLAWGHAGTVQATGRILPREGCGVKRKGHKILGVGCGSPLDRIHGESPEFISEIRSAGLNISDSDKLIAFAFAKENTREGSKKSLLGKLNSRLRKKAGRIGKIRRKKTRIWVVRLEERPARAAIPRDALSDDPVPAAFHQPAA
jgi:hypothetical protein